MYGMQPVNRGEYRAPAPINAPRPALTSSCIVEISAAYLMGAPTGRPAVHIAASQDYAVARRRSVVTARLVALDAAALALDIVSRCR